MTENSDYREYEGDCHELEHRLDESRAAQGGGLKTAFEDAREAMVMTRKNYDESDKSASISFKSANLDG